MSQRILITGGAGYIGSTLVPELLNLGHSVTVIDNFLYGQTSLAAIIGNPRLELVYGDVRDKATMTPHIGKADVIIPLAAIVGAPACDKDPILSSSINKEAIYWMLKKISPNQRIIMPTTNSAYGSGDKNNFCDEKSPLNPLSLYARDKVAVENVLMQNSNATSFRLATVFGISPRMRLDLLVNNFTLRAVTDGFIVVFEGHFKRNYIHVKDVSLAFQLAIESPEKFNGEIFNVGLSEANISKLDLCERIKRIIPSFTYVESQIGSDPDKRNYVVSNEKIEKAGFKTQIGLDDGIRELIKGLPMFNHKPFTNL